MEVNCTHRVPAPCELCVFYALKILKANYLILLPAIFLNVANSPQLELGLQSISHSPRYSIVLFRLSQRNIDTLDNFLASFPDLSKIQAFVHTSWKRNGDISWNRMKITVTLHQQKIEIVSYISQLELVSFFIRLVFNQLETLGPRRDAGP